MKHTATITTDKVESYWEGKGRLQALLSRLDRLIPDSGPCEHARGKNKALDRLRRARNCYYDLYNNGLCNRASEFRRLFGFSPTRYDGGRIYFGESLDGATNETMDEFIIAAAREQGLIDEPEVTQRVLLSALRDVLSTRGLNLDKTLRDRLHETAATAELSIKAQEITCKVI